MIDFLLVPFQATQDAEIAQESHMHLPEQSSLVSLTNPNELKGIFQTIDMTIAMRFMN